MSLDVETIGPAPLDPNAAATTPLHMALRNKRESLACHPGQAERADTRDRRHHALAPPHHRGGDM